MTTPGKLVTDAQGIAEVLASTKRIAVLGIKTEAQADQPAFYVPQYMAKAGFDIVPVPVYYPEVTTILGRPVVRRLADVPPPIDMLNVFRRAKDLALHEAEILAVKPKTVWLQLGIREPGFAKRLVEAGIDVVQDRCLMVDHRAWAASR